MPRRTREQVVNRHGNAVELDLNKIRDRIDEIADERNLNNIETFHLLQQVVGSIGEGTRTSEIDECIASICIGKITEDMDYFHMASYIAVSNLHRTVLGKNNKRKFSEFIEKAITNEFIDTGEKFPLIDERYIKFLNDNREALDEMIDYSRDYNFNYFALKTLTNGSYLMKDGSDRILEVPQDTLLREAIQCYHRGGIDNVRRAYDYLSAGYYTHATPTLINSLTVCGQLASCFLIAQSDDSIEGMFADTIPEVAYISKRSGGVGLHVHNIRSNGERVKSTNGKTNGLVPYLKTIEGVALQVDQGSKRPGAVAIYLSPIHPDAPEVYPMRQPDGAEGDRARHLFYGAWIPDEFMRRVEQEFKTSPKEGEPGYQPVMWSMFDPNRHPELYQVYGDKFTELYRKLESEGKAKRTMPIKDIWTILTRAQRLSGMPYMCYADAANNKSNQKHLGPIHSSNLCVHGDTMIKLRFDDELVSKPISSYEGKNITVWNGYEWTDVVVKKTAENISMMRVTVTRDGITRTLVCTKNHKFILNSLDFNDRIDAANLKPNDVLTDGHIVTSISAYPGRHDSYCFNDNLRHTGMFNDIITGNCTEIMEYSDAQETAVCNLASIALPKYVNEDGTFNYEKLHEVARFVTHGLNNVIDENKYPTENSKRSNMRHRPIGMGVQGLADVFMLMNIPFDSEEARVVNSGIFETIYHAGIVESIEIAKREGQHESFPGSPASKGKFQFDLWDDYPTHDSMKDHKTRFLGIYDWEALRTSMVQYGLRNSLFVAPMPTAGTSQILGNYESFEPVTSNIFRRETKSGNFIVINKHLIRLLESKNMYNTDIINSIILEEGSIQHLQFLTEHEKKVFKTVWEYSMKPIIEMAQDRAKFIDQSMSLNMYMMEPTDAKLTALHLDTWRRGLKTGMYYLRSRSKVRERKENSLTASTTTKSETKKEKVISDEALLCSLTNKDACTMCSS